MAKINQQLAGHPQTEFRAPRLSTSLKASTFGEVMYFHRMNLGQRQRTVAIAAGISESYLSELENCKRIAPPRSTALRIARALNLAGIEANKFAGFAESERASLLHDRHLPPKVRQLMGMLRVAGPLLPSELLESMQAKLEEVCM